MKLQKGSKSSKWAGTYRASSPSKFTVFTICMRVSKRARNSTSLLLLHKLIKLIHDYITHTYNFVWFGVKDCHRDKYPKPISDLHPHWGTCNKKSWSTPWSTLLIT